MNWQVDRACDRAGTAIWDAGLARRLQGDRIHVKHWKNTHLITVTVKENHIRSKKFLHVQFHTLNLDKIVREKKKNNIVTFLKNEIIFPIPSTVKLIKRL